MTHINPRTEQYGFLGINDDGNLANATAKAAVNGNWSQAPDVNFRVRFGVEEDASADAAVTLVLEYNRNGAGWNRVNAASSVVRSSASPNVADNASITNTVQFRITSGWSATSSEAGVFDEVDGAIPAKTLNNERTELEFCVQIRSADVANNDTIQLRITNNGVVLDSYLQTPTVTVVVATEHTDAATAVLKFTPRGVDRRIGSAAVAGSYYFDAKAMVAALSSALPRPFSIGVWYKSDWGFSVPGNVQAPTSLGRLGFGQEGTLPLLSSPTVAEAYEEYAGDNKFAGAGAGPTEGAWFSHVAVFASASSRKAYGNGTGGTEDTTSLASPTPNPEDLYVGQFPDGSWKFRGWIAHVFVWDFELTAQEVTDWHNGYIVERAGQTTSWFDLTLNDNGALEISETIHGNLVLNELSGGSWPLFDTGHGPTVEYSPPTVDAATVRLTLTPSAVEEYTPSGNQFTDSDTALLTLTASGTEFKEILDSATVSLALTPSATELHEAVDTNTALLALTPSGTELQADEYTDAATASVLFTPSSVDNLEYNDASTASLALTPSATEIREQYDAATIPLALTPSATESAEYVDAATSLLLLTPGSIQEGIERTDSETAQLGLLPSAVELSEFADQATITITLQASAVEEREQYDASTVALFLTASATEIAETVDASTGVLTLTPSGVDEYTQPGATEYTDAATLTLIFTVSGAEQRISEDSNTTTLGLIPSAIEDSHYVDTNTATVRFTPTGSDEAQYVEGVENRLNLTPSGTETTAYIEESVVPLQFSLSATESYTQFDAETIPLGLVPSSTDTSDFVDAATAISTLTPGGADIHNTASSEDAATLYLTLTPGVTLEIHYLFDTLLVGTLTRRWGGSLEVRRWSGTYTSRWSGSMATRRWSATLGGRLWSGIASRKWSGTLGRS